MADNITTYDEGILSRKRRDKYNAGFDQDTTSIQIANLSDVKSDAHRGDLREIWEQFQFGALDNMAFGSLSAFDQYNKQYGGPDALAGFEEGIAGAYAGDFATDLSGWGKFGRILGGAATLPFSLGISGTIGRGVTSGTGRTINYGLKKAGFRGVGVSKASKDLVDEGAKIIAASGDDLAATFSKKADKIVQDAFEIVGKGTDVSKQLKKIDAMAWETSTKGLLKDNLRRVLDLPSRSTPQMTRMLDELTDETFAIASRNNPYVAQNLFNTLGYRTRQVLNVGTLGITGQVGKRFGNPVDAGLIFGSMFNDASIGLVHGALHHYAHEGAHYRAAHLYDNESTREARETFEKKTNGEVFWEALYKGGEEAAIFSLMGPPKFIKNWTMGGRLPEASQRKLTADLRNYLAGSTKAYWGRLQNRSTAELRTMLDGFYYISGKKLQHSLSEKWAARGSRWWQNATGETGKAEMVEMLKEVRKTFLLRAPIEFTKDAGKEFVAAIPRMVTGALAMNAPTIVNSWTEHGHPWNGLGEDSAEISANLLIASWFMRRPHSFHSKPSGTLMDNLFNRGQLPAYANAKRNEFRKNLSTMQFFGLRGKKLEDMARMYQISDFIRGEDQTASDYTRREVENTPEFKDIKRYTELIEAQSENRRNVDVDSGEVIFSNWDDAFNKYLADQFKIGKMDQNAIDEAYNKKIIADAIISKYNEKLDKKILLDAITPSEANQVINDLASIKFGKDAITRHDPYGEIDKWYMDRIDDIIDRPNRIQKDAIMDMYNALLGEGTHNWNELKQIFAAPDIRQMKQKWGDSEARELFYDLYQEGIDNNWIVDPKGVHAGRSVVEAITGERIKKAIEKFDYYTDALMELTTPDYKQKGVDVDRSILANPIWGQRLYDRRYARQFKNFYEVVTNGKEYTISKDDADRYGEDIDQMMFRIKPEIEAESLNAIKDLVEREGLQDYVSKMHEIIKLTHPSLKSTQPALLDATGVRAMERNTRQLFGDVISNENVYRQFVRDLQDRAIRDIGINSVFNGLDMRASFLYLKNDPLFNASTRENVIDLPTKRTVDEVLYTALQDKTIDNKTHSDLTKFYDMMHTEIEGANAGFVRFDRRVGQQNPGDYVRILQSARQQGLAYMSGMGHNYIENQMSMLRNLHGKLTIKADNLGKGRDSNEIREGIAEDIAFGTLEKSDARLRKSADELKFELETTASNAKAIAETIKEAISNGETLLLHSLLSNHKNLVDIVDRINRMPLEGDIQLEYYAELAKWKDDVLRNRDDLIRNELTINEMINEQVKEWKGHIAPKDVPSKIFKITQQQFSTRYGIDMWEIESILSFHKNNIKDAKDIQAGIKSMYQKLISDPGLAENLQGNKPLADKVESWKQFMNSKAFTGLVDFNKKNEFHKYVYEPMYDLIHANEYIKSLDGKTTPYTQFQIESDVYSIVSSYFSKVPIKSLSIDMQTGTLKQKYDIVGDVERGVMGLIKTLDSESQFNIFPLSNSGIDPNGNSINVPAHLLRVQADLRKLDKGYDVTDLHAQSEFYMKGTLDALKESDPRSHVKNKEFEVINLDEGTNILIRVDRDSALRENIKAQYEEGGYLYEKINALYDGNIRKHDKTGDMGRLLQRLRSPQNKQDVIEGVNLTRWVLDMISIVPEIVDRNGINTHKAELLAANKYVKLAEPKNSYIGTPENLKRTADFYRNAESEQMKAVYREIKDVIDPATGDAKELKVVSIADEVPTYKDGSDVKVSVFSSLARETSKLKELLKDGEITQTDYDVSLASIKDVTKSVVDGSFFLTKKNYLAALAQIGITENMIIFNEATGAIDGFQSGAIKPTVTKSRIISDTSDPNYGRVETFYAKTSFQYDPKIAAWLESRGLDGLTFGSANKINQFKARAGEKFFTSDPEGENFPTKSQSDSENNLFLRLEDHWEPPNLSSGVHKKTWVDEVTKLGDRDILDHHKQSLRWEDISLRNASHPSDATVGSNLGNYMSTNNGIAEWIGIDQKISRHKDAVFTNHSNPYFRVAMAREIFAARAELGDLHGSGVVNSLMKRGRLIMEPSEQRKHDDLMINYFMNNGSISGGTVKDGSYDVMGPEYGNLKTTIRSKIEDKNVVKVFGEYLPSYYGGQEKLFNIGLDGVQRSKIIHSKIEYAPHRGKDVTRTNVDGFFVEIPNVGKVLAVEGYGITKEGRTIDLDTYKIIESFTQDAQLNRKTYKDLLAQESEVMDLVGGGAKRNTISLSDAAVMLRAKYGDKVSVGVLNSRQPRNMIGDLVLNKIAVIQQDIGGGVIVPMAHNHMEAGNVSKINHVDAIRTQDADFDMDKSFSYSAAPEMLWKEAGRLAGDISNEPIYVAVEKRMNEFTQEMPQLLGDNVKHAQLMAEVNMARGRWIKMHQTTTYLNNIFRFNQDVMSFPLKEIAKEAKYANEVVTVKFNKDNLNLTAQGIGDYAKLYIDMYKKLISDGELKNIETRQHEILFGENGLFQVYREVGGKSVPDKGFNLNEPGFHLVRDAIVGRIIRPINKYVGYNRGLFVDAGNIERKAVLSDYHNARERIQSNMQTDNIFLVPDKMNIEPGLINMQNYFANSRNSFDVAMNGLWETHRTLGSTKSESIRGKKYSDPSTEIKDWIESGQLQGTDKQSQQEKWVDFIQKTFKDYVYDEGAAYRLQDLNRQISHLNGKKAELERYAATEEALKEDTKYQDITDRLNWAEELKSTLDAALGTHVSNDILMERNDVSHMITETKAPGTWPNPKKQPVVVLDKRGMIKEVVLPGKRNGSFINRSDKLIENGRRFQTSDPLEQKALRSLFQALAGEVVHIDGQGRKHSLHSVMQERLTNDALKNIIEKVNATHTKLKKLHMGVDKQTELANSKQNAILDEFSSPRFDTPMKKHALLYSLIRPLHSKKVISSRGIVTEMGTGTTVDLFYMENPFSATMKTILSQIENGQREGRGITSKEAADMLTNIVDLGNMGYVESTDRYLNTEYSRSKYYTEPTNIEKGYMTRELELNQSIYDAALIDKKNVRESAKLLIDYAEGTGRHSDIDPIDMYRALQVINSEGGKQIAPSQIFVRQRKISNEDGTTRVFGEHYIFTSDADGKRMRSLGKDMKSEVSDWIKEQTKCLIGR